GFRHVSIDFEETSSHTTSPGPLRRTRPVPLDLAGERSTPRGNPRYRTRQRDRDGPSGPHRRLQCRRGTDLRVATRRGDWAGARGDDHSSLTEGLAPPRARPG